MLYLLYLAAFVLTFLSLTVFPSGCFLLSGIATLVILRRYPLPWAIIASSIPFFFVTATGAAPFLGFLLLFEPLVVDRCLRSDGLGELIRAELLYLVFLAAPLFVTFQLLLLDQPLRKTLATLSLFAGSRLVNASLASAVLRLLHQRSQAPTASEVPTNMRFLFFGVAGGFPLLLLILLNSWDAEQLLGPQHHQRLTQACAALYPQVTEHNERAMHFLNRLAYFVTVEKELPPQELTDALARLRSEHPGIDALEAFSPTQEVLFSSRRPNVRPHITPGEKSLWKHWLGGMADQDRLQIHILSAGGDPRLLYCQTVEDRGQVLGEVRLLIAPAFWETSLNLPGVTEEGAWRLMDRQGNVLFWQQPHRNQVQLLAGLPLQEFSLSAPSHLVWDPQQEQLHFLPFWSLALPGLPVHRFDSPLALLVDVPPAALGHHRTRILTTALALLLFPAFLPWFFWWKKPRPATAPPLSCLLKTTEGLSERILGQEDIQWPETGDTEYDLIIANIRSMADMLKAKLAEVRDYQMQSLRQNDSVIAQQNWEIYSTSRKLRAEMDQRFRIEELNAELQAAEAKYRFLVEKSLVGVFILRGSQFVYLNPRFSRIFGFPPLDILGQIRLVDLVYKPDRKMVFHHIRDLTRGTVNSVEFNFRGLTKDQRVIHLDVVAGRGTFEGQFAIMGTLMDSTDKHQAEEAMAHMAYHDPLTNLPNRNLFKDRLEQALSQARRYDHQLALMFVDLDRFKAINDTLGHSCGDTILEEVATRLTGCVRESDTVSRFGGDEFNILLAKVARNEDAELVARKILRTMAWPFDVDNREINLSCSIGIAAFPEHGEDSQTLFKNADTALYRAKDLGRNNLQFYHHAMNAQALDRMELENGLRHALARQELTLHYQPQVNLGTGRLVGMEALIRWSHPERGVIGPDTFIPLAEELGLIFPIGEWVLRSACRQALAWVKQYDVPLRLGVNVSPSQFEASGFMDTVNHVLSDLQFPARLLNLEITESVVIRDITETIDRLNALHQVGITVAIDDFGVGYSSLSYLKNLPVDHLKLDRTFVMGLPDKEDDAHIARHIIEMTRELGIQVIAEGVETPEQLAFLRELGCDEGQGYLFSRPIGPQEFKEWLLSPPSF